MQAVFLDLASLAPEDLDLSGFAPSVDDWRSYPATGESERLAHIGDADIVVTNKVLLDEAVLRAAPRLKLICVTATGVNNIALDTARELGIVASNVVAYATASVVQHVFALMLAHHTRLFSYIGAVGRGAWSRSPQFCLLDYPVRELCAMTLGIVGYGELGKGVARIAEAFGMQVLIAQRQGGVPAPDRVALDELLPAADVVSLHVPLLDTTRRLIDERALGLMKRDALLINTARGALVDSLALAKALRDGQIGGAALDVLDMEPPPPDHPLLDPDIPNLILTPHTAWAGHQARQRVVDETVASIRAFVAGRPRNRVA